MEPLVLVDAFNLVFRSHFAHRSLSYDEQPTGVLYGFIKALMMLKQEVSSRIVVCWDHGMPGGPHEECWRKKVYPPYKADRSGERSIDGDVALKQTVVLAHAIDLLGFHNVAAPRLEADDLIGVLTGEHRAESEIYIYAKDQDFYQLLGDQVFALVPQPNVKWKRVDQQTVEDTFGVPVRRWASYLALGGDSCDNIRPLKGVGPKTAAKFIALGVKPALGWQSQPKEFTAKYAHFKPEWSNVNRARSITYLPRSFDFAEKITGTCIKDVKARAAATNWERSRQDVLKRKEKFLAICSTYGLNEFTMRRHQMFAQSETES